MAFVDKIIGPDERLIGVSTVHWIYAANGIFWMAGFLILGVYLDSFDIYFDYHFPGNPGLAATSLMAHTGLFICMALAIILFLLYFVMMVTTEVALTTKRIIYKRGWIFVNVNEADLEEIKAAGVINGWFGRFLNYGYIELDARFIKNMNFPAISDPYRFVKAVNEIRGNLRQDSMTVVLDGHGEPKVGKEKKGKMHKLEDDRYESISNDPVEATREFIAETKETIHKRSEEVSESIAPLSPAVAAAVPQVPQQLAPQQEPHLVDFRKDSARERLREKVIKSFSRTTKKKKPV